MTKIAPKRLKFEVDGQTVYEWEQTLDDINVYVKAPLDIRGKEVKVKFEATKISVMARGQILLEAETFGKIKTSDCFWTIEDGEIHLSITKQIKAEQWAAVFKGHAQLDPLAEQDVKKSLMLERFQAENPGFDFSGAEFSGNVPDAHTFMGGMSTTK